MKGEEASNQKRASFRRRSSASVTQGLGSHGRSREISPRRVKSRELFSEFEYCKEVEPLSSVPLCSASGIENPDEQSPCLLLLQSPRISPPPFATSIKATQPAEKFHNHVPPCNFDRGQGRSRFGRLHILSRLLRFFSNRKQKSIYASLNGSSV